MGSPVSDERLRKLEDVVADLARKSDQSRSKIYERLNAADQRIGEVGTAANEANTKLELHMRESERRHNETRQDSKEHREQMRSEVRALTGQVEAVNKAITGGVADALKSPSRAPQEDRFGVTVFKWAAGLIALLVAGFLALAKIVVPGIGGPPS